MEVTEGWLSDRWGGLSACLDPCVLPSSSGSTPHGVLKHPVRDKQLWLPDVAPEWPHPTRPDHRVFLPRIKGLGQAGCGVPILVPM